MPSSVDRLTGKCQDGLLQALNLSDRVQNLIQVVDDEVWELLPSLHTECESRDADSGQNRLNQGDQQDRIDAWPGIQALSELAVR